MGCCLNTAAALRTSRRCGPVNDAARGIDAEDGVVLGAFDHRTITLLAAPQRFVVGAHGCVFLRALAQLEEQDAEQRRQADAVGAQERRVPPRERGGSKTRP
jgi:hypothetical protein